MKANHSDKYSKLKYSLGLFCFLVLGIIIGGYLFSQSQPRSIIAVNKCNDSCYKSSDLLGLLASVGFTKFDNFIPNVVLETDKTIALKHPFPEARIHYLVIPKKDIKNIGEISLEDQDYLIDAYAVMSELIRMENLKEYRVITNGPGFQNVTYLHFHLRAN
ncbi:MAG: hypothetical protein US96_C0003G0026 [Candidatus Woesebacteria bacterium GW2011_GWB1_38_5b]|uniref:HIT domain-containing protein n=1 Tax=Candidatus Woesebacteria bacterium GW2011_GWB1_38_5b TaxID=1618569 RepID=A0A0G0K873_9BACT|nr:MAG: hypothetical protein US96_C0003G0026 [Candidatus Woesebacteria bacterium GW2011_GWB1_38_5b]KKQ76800.1 MAG: hypothetical protein UT00_C0032G0002 [Parcubacteria group bacterium GW2011_GWA1_38_7]